MSLRTPVEPSGRKVGLASSSHVGYFPKPREGALRAFGVLHCESSSLNMPLGAFSIRSMHPWLSAYSILMPGMHSSV